MMQFLSVLVSPKALQPTPPPVDEAELPVTVQLLSVPAAAPPPCCAELPLTVQLFNVLKFAPPPHRPAEL